MSTGPTPNSDPLLERLERLNQRRSMPNRFPPPPPPGQAPIKPAQNTRRRGPARAAKVGALVLSCASTGGLAAAFAYLNEGAAASQALAALPQPIAVTPTTAPTASSKPATTPAATAPTATSAGTTPAPTTPATTTPATTVPAVAAVAAVNGDVIDTRFGPVQVQAQFSNGQLTDVAVVQYPDGDGKSVRINARALPTLRSEALAAQDATVDTVSGATYTSNAYVQSLQSAIDEARAASLIA